MAVMSFKMVEKTEKLLDRVVGQLQESIVENKLELDIGDLENVVAGAERKVKVVLAGQYSAGKSSIIKMLTGNKEIAIGEAITTQISTVYQWNGVEIMDTPGIATGYRPDHDAIAKQAISQADLLLFVITNEGFDSLLVECFRKLAYELPDIKSGQQKGMGKLPEMMLVFNKMDRFGNTQENHQILLEDVYTSLDMDADCQLPICFLSAESYLDSLEEDDEETRQELLERSGYDSFVATLNNFISAKGIIGRQIAPVQLAEGMLQDAIQLLSGKTGDVDIDAADALLAKTIRTLRRLSTRGTIAIEDVFAQYASEIRAYGHSISDNLGVTEDAVDESAINHHLRDISRRCNSDLELKMQDLCDEMEQELSNIQQSGLGYELQVRLDSGLSNNPESSNMANSVVKGIAGCKDLVKGLDTNMIKSIAHIFNYKFKPWGAVKLLNGLQKWVPIAGDVLNIAVELHGQYQQSENQRKLREAKNNIVSTFNELADGFEQDGITFAREKFALPVRDILAGQEEAKAELDAMKKNKKECVTNMQQLVKECRDLQWEIRKESRGNING